MMSFAGHPHDPPTRRATRAPAIREGGLLRLPWAALGACALALVAWFYPVRAGRRLMSEPRWESSNQRTFRRLRQAIVGNDKASVVAVFGPPPATAGVEADSEWSVSVPVYLRSDTWYYPLDKIEQSAICIRFAQGIAQDAQVLYSPTRYV
jgi:hypothetical protein